MRTPETKGGRPISMPGHIGELARAMGGMTPISKALRTPPRTIRTWANGTPIPGAAQVAIERLCDQHSVAYPGAVEV